MSALAIFKLLKTAKDVHDYVKKPNNLDAQNDMILVRLEKAEKKNSELAKRLKKLEASDMNRETKKDGIYSSLKKEIQKLKNKK